MKHNYEMSSGNVFKDLGLPDADTLKIKADLAVKIVSTINARGLTQADAARRMRISQPKVSALMRGEFPALSERKLMECLTCLGFDIEISVKPAHGLIGHLHVLPC